MEQKKRYGDKGIGREKITVLEEADWVRTTG